MLSRHRRAAIAAGVVGVVLVLLGLYWFQPRKLFVDETVNEALPGAAAAAEQSPAGGSPAPDTPADATISEEEDRLTVLSEGPFRSLEHETTGRAKILELGDGRRFVRLEDLRTSNGPDLVVLLSDTPATEDSWGAYDDGGIDRMTARPIGARAATGGGLTWCPRGIAP